MTSILVLTVSAIMAIFLFHYLTYYSRHAAYDIFYACHFFKLYTDWFRYTYVIIVHLHSPEINQYTDWETTC